MRNATLVLQIREEVVQHRLFVAALCLGGKVGVELIDTQQLRAELAKRLFRLDARVLCRVQFVDDFLCRGADVVHLVLHGVDAHTGERCLNLRDIRRFVPQVILQRQKIRRFDSRMALQPRLCLCDGIVVQVLTVRNRHILAQLAENVVRQLVDGVRHCDCRDLLLHLPQFIQCDRRADGSEAAGLFVPQHRKPLGAVGDIRCHDLQFKPVIERREDLLLRVVEVRDLIRRREERNRRNVVSPALIGVLSLIERREQRVQHAVIALEDLIQKADVRLRQLACGIHHRLRRVQRRHCLSICFHLCGELHHGLVWGVMLRVVALVVHRSLQSFPHFLIPAILFQQLLRHCAGDKAREVDPAKELLLVGLLREQTLKLHRAGDPSAKGVDRIALGLAGIAKDKQVLAGQQSNGDHLNQFLTLRHLCVHISDHAEHFVPQAHAAAPPFAPP